MQYKYMFMFPLQNSARRLINVQFKPNNIMTIYVYMANEELGKKPDHMAPNIC